MSTSTQQFTTDQTKPSARNIRYRKNTADIDRLKLDPLQLRALLSLSVDVVGVLSSEHAEVLPRLGLVRAVRGGFVITPRGLAARTTSTATKAHGSH